MGYTYLVRVDLGLLPCSFPSPWAPACEIKNMLLCTLGGNKEWGWDGTWGNISWCFTPSPCYPLGMLTSSCSPAMRWCWWLGLSQGITESPRGIVDPDSWNLLQNVRRLHFGVLSFEPFLQYRNNNSNSKNLWHPDTERILPTDVSCLFLFIFFF